MSFQSYIYRDNEECFKSTVRLEVQLGVSMVLWNIILILAYFC